MSSRPKVVIAGLGNMGSTYAKTAIRHSEELTLCGVYEPNLALREQRRTEFPADVCSTDSFEALLSLAPDLVLLATPTDTHFALAKLALDASIPVAVEKPLAPSIAEAQALVQAAGHCAVPLFPLQHVRFDPAYRTLMEMVRGCAFGRILHGSFRRSGPVPCAPHFKNPTAGGGLWDLGIHDFNYVVGLLGPASIESTRGQCLPNGSSRFDIVAATLKWPGNPQIVSDGWIDITVGWDRPPGLPCEYTFRMVFERGELSFYSDGQTGTLRVHGADLSDERHTVRDEAYEAMLLHVATCARDRQLSPVLAPDNILQSLQLVDSIEHQLQSSMFQLSA